MLRDRTMTLYLLIFALIGTGGFLFFWVIGAIMLLLNNGGQINDIGFTPAGRTLFLGFPVLAVVAVALAGVLFWAKRDTLAVGLAGLPLAAGTLFYLYLTLRDSFGWWF